MDVNDQIKIAMQVHECWWYNPTGTDKRREPNQFMTRVPLAGMAPKDIPMGPNSNGIKMWTAYSKHWSRESHYLFPSMIIPLLTLTPLLIEQFWNGLCENPMEVWPSCKSCGRTRPIPKDGLRNDLLSSSCRKTSGARHYERMDLCRNLWEWIWYNLM